MQRKTLFSLFIFCLITMIVLFRVVPAGSDTIREAHIHDFIDGDDGAAPWAGLTQDRFGRIFGTTNNGGDFFYGTVFTLEREGGRWEEKVLHQFGAPGDGMLPTGDLVTDGHGNIFGTASLGGAAPGCDQNGYQCGIVYELSTVNGHIVETILRSFSGNDGATPEGGLTLAPNGDLYGTTRNGGLFRGYCPAGCGTIFKLARTRTGWSFTTLYRFRSLYDGYDSQMEMTLDRHGNLFGTTVGGGNGNGCVLDDGCGTIFELERTAHGWTEHIIYRFQGQNDDGAYPFAGLAIDAQGNLFGTTSGAGAFNHGTAFELEHAQNGWTEKILYAFRGGSDGADPSGTLTARGDNNYYGVTTQGGNLACQDGCGTVYRLTRMPNGEWTHTVLYGFNSYTDGFTPIGRLLICEDGNLFGTTFNGGRHNAGEIFEVLP